MRTWAGDPKQVKSRESNMAHRPGLDGLLCGACEGWGIGNANTARRRLHVHTRTRARTHRQRTCDSRIRLRMVENSGVRTGSGWIDWRAARERASEGDRRWKECRCQVLSGRAHV